MSDFDGIIDPPADANATVPSLSQYAKALAGPNGPMNAQAIALTKRLKAVEARDAGDVPVDDGAGGSLFSTVQGWLNYLKSSAGASIVGFFQLGSTLLRNLQAKVREQVSVTDYPGVDITGATGSAAGIQACLNAFPGTKIVPDGEYLIDADIIVPDNVCIKFSQNAKFKASANNRIFFKATTHAYFSQIHNPQLDGNGKTGVVGFDMSSFRLNAGIFNACMVLMEAGFIGRQGCFGTIIHNPTAYGVKFPIVLVENNSVVCIDNPVFDNSVVAGGDGGGSGVTVQFGAGSNLGPIVRGGYIQGFQYGIDDTGIGTYVDGTYFEACTDADINANTTARNCRYKNVEHWGTVGAAAYRFRGTDSMTIHNPTMGSGARTQMYDIDATNTNCVEYRPESNAFFNTPLGSTASIKAVAIQTKANFTPVAVGSTTAGTASYTVQDGKYTRSGNTVSFQLSLAWTGHTGTGGLLVTGLPAGLAPTNFSPNRRLAVVAQFPFTGPTICAILVGAGTTIGVREVSTAGAETLIVIPAAGTLDVFGSYEIE